MKGEWRLVDGSGDIPPVILVHEEITTARHPEDSEVQQDYVL